MAVVIAHELAHQWFGDLGIIHYFTCKNLKLNNLENDNGFSITILVTMEWWTDLWLNEGFASYTEYIGTDHVDPESAILGIADSSGTKYFYSPTFVFPFINEIWCISSEGANFLLNFRRYTLLPAFLINFIFDKKCPIIDRFILESLQPALELDALGKCMCTKKQKVNLNV